MINVIENDGTVILSVAGTDRVTVLNAGELKGVMVEQFAKVGKGIILDLDNIKFMDSTGISVLISGVKTSREKNKHFALRNVKGDVARLLSLMKIDKIIDIEK